MHHLSPALPAASPCSALFSQSSAFCRATSGSPPSSPSSACQHIQVLPTLKGLPSPSAASSIHWFPHFLSFPFLQTSEGSRVYFHTRASSPPVHSLTSFCPVPVAVMRPPSPRFPDLCLFLFPVPSSLYMVIDAANYTLLLETFFTNDLGEMAPS